MECELTADAFVLSTVITEGDVRRLIFWLSSFGTDYVLTARLSDPSISTWSVSDVETIIRIVDALVPVLLIDRPTALALTSFIHGLCVLSPSFVSHFSETNFIPDVLTQYLTGSDLDMRVRALRIAREVWLWEIQTGGVMVEWSAIIDLLRAIPLLWEEEVEEVIEIWVGIVHSKKCDADIADAFWCHIGAILAQFPSARIRRSVGQAALGVTNISYRRGLPVFLEIVVAAVSQVSDENGTACPAQIWDLLRDVVSTKTPDEALEFYDSIPSQSYIYALHNGVENAADSCLAFVGYFCLRNQRIADESLELFFLISRKKVPLDARCPLRVKISWLRFAHAMMFQLKLGVVDMLLEEGVINITASVISFEPDGESDPDPGPTPDPEEVIGTILMGIHIIWMMLEMSKENRGLLSDVVSDLHGNEVILGWIGEMSKADFMPDIPLGVWVPDEEIDIRALAPEITRIVQWYDEEVSGSGRTW
jgi:hypothetical protein